MRGRDFRARDEFLEAPLQRRAFEQDATAATQAAQTDVGAEARDLPVEAAARVNPAQTNYVTEVELEDRG